jgi:hypothetical protein
MNNNKQTQGRFGLPSPSKIIEAAVQRIGKFVLHRHLAHWRPISTAPNNHDVELRIKDENVIARLSFPCRQTNTGAWINADLGTSLHIQPIAWRLWQKAGSLQSHSGRALARARPVSATRTCDPGHWHDVGNGWNSSMDRRRAHTVACDERAK